MVIGEVFVGADKDGAGTRIASKFDVGKAVADHDTSIQVEVRRNLLGHESHLRIGFSVVVGLVGELWTD